MPDTFTHIALPTLFSRLYRQPLIPPIILIGAVLPDYLREFFKLVLPVAFYPAVYAFHSLIGIICVSMLLSSLFESSLRTRIFISLFVGQSFHLFLDVLQSYFGGGRIYLLLPYWKTFQIGLYSDTYWIYLFLFSITTFTVYCLVNMLRTRSGFRK